MTGSKDKTVRIWYVATGAQLLQHIEKQAVGARFSPDGKYVAVPAFDDVVHLFDATTFAEIKQFSARTPPSLDARFSPDSRSLAVAGGSTITIFDIGAGHEIRKIDTGDEVKDVAFSPGGKTVASIVNQRIFIWNASDGQLVGSSDKTVPLSSLTLAFSPDGTRLAASGLTDNSIYLWDAASLLNVPLLKGVWVARAELSSSIPESWRVNSADKARYVVEVGDEREEIIESCQYSIGGIGAATNTINRIRIVIEIRIVDAASV